MPSEAMQVTLASVFVDEKTFRPGLEKDLARWFWASAFQQTYSQGANTQAVTDAKALRAWAESELSEPSTFGNFKIDEEALKDERRRNEMLVRGLACLIVKNGGKDWLTGEELCSFGGSSDRWLDYYHIFPTEFLIARGITLSDLVVNITPVSGKTNKSLRSDSPSSVIMKNKIHSHAIESHGIEWDLLKEDDWSGFLNARSAVLKRWMQRAVSGN